MQTRRAVTIANELVGVVETASQKLRLIQETEASQKPAPGKWSRKEIIGHLIDSATNNHQRFVRAQMVDELTFPGYDQDEWVRRQDYNTKPWSELVELWRLINRHVAHIIRNLSQEKFQTPCRIGEAPEPTALGLIVEDYLTHLRHHLHQIGVVNV
jgi:hypothetical protein